MLTIFRNCIIVLSMSLIVSSIQAQSHHHEHDHEHPPHKFELGMANSMVYLGNEKEWSYGLHFHGVKQIGDSDFGVGLSYERIFDDHRHNTIGIVGNYSPTAHWHLSLSPGLAFEGSEFDHVQPALHIEAAYDFELGLFHLGPLFEIAFDREDYHLSFGLHLGIALH